MMMLMKMMRDGLLELVGYFSFAKVLTKEKAAAVGKQDLARSVLVTAINNIGSIALNAAIQHGIERIVFAGWYFSSHVLA